MVPTKHIAAREEFSHWRLILLLSADGVGASLQLRRNQRHGQHDDDEAQIAAAAGAGLVRAAKDEDDEEQRNPDCHETPPAIVCAFLLI